MTLALAGTTVGVRALGARRLAVHVAAGATLSACAALTACDASDDGARAAAEANDADTRDADTRDAADAGDTRGDAADTASPPDPAVVVSSDDRGVGAFDDLFPDLAGDDLVWVRVSVDAAHEDAEPPVDCFACPYCGCRFDMMYRRLPDGAATVLHEGTQPRSGPRVGDGVAVWLTDYTVMWRDLARGEDHTLTQDTWLQATPTPFGGALWWYAYDYRFGGYGIFALDRARGVAESRLTASLSDAMYMSSSSLSGLATRQPFVLGAEAAYYLEWLNGLVVRRWPYGPEATTVDVDPARQITRLAVREGDDLVTFSFATEDGCQASACDLALDAYGGDGARPIAPDADPSLYVAPAVDGARLAWVDHRDGAYAVYGLDASGREARLTSEAAQVGALSSIAASGGRIAWADRRSGRWRIMARTW